MKDAERPPAMASLLFDADPPGAEAMRIRLETAGARVADAPPSPMDEWALLAAHDRWGAARIVAPKPDVQAQFLPSDSFLRFMPGLSPAELASIGSAKTMIAVMLADESASGLAALRDRKRLLRVAACALAGDGLGAIDVDAQRVWSQDELDDELAHDADLDVHGVFGLHAVNDGQRVTWLHSHGLAALGRFDFDILNPAPWLFAPGGGAIPAIAFAILEGRVTEHTRELIVGWPGGVVRFAPARTFDRKADEEDRGGRTLDAIENHVEDRAVLCEPVGFFGRLFGLHEPSRFLSGDIDEGTVFIHSVRATELMADRARRTYPVLRRLDAELAPVVGPPLVKLSYEAADGGREYLWFQVHRLLEDRIDATLTNQPHAVPGLRRGDRGEHAIDRLGDWMLGSPRGLITPRTQAAARRVREELPQLLARASRSKGPSPQ